MKQTSIPSFVRSAIGAGWSAARIADTLNAAGGLTIEGHPFDEDSVLIMAIGLVFPDVLALPDPKR